MARLAQDHRAIHPDPIRLAKGEPADLSGREDMWDGHRWLWAQARDGRAGWIPDTLLDPDGRATCDYSAAELTLPKGAHVAILRDSHGWSWSRAENGATGWLPSRILTPLP